MTLLYRYFTVLCILAWSVPAIAQPTKSVKETVDLASNGRVSIDTYKGTIDVKTWDRDEVQIDALIEADQHEDLVDLTDIEIYTTDRGVAIETDYDRAKKSKLRRDIFNSSNMSLPFVHYTVRMPKTAELHIKDYKSDTDIVGLQADLSFETYKGKAVLEDITGDLTVDTYKGIVMIDELEGSLRAETYKGEITAVFEDFDGRSRVDTYRGEIRLILPEDAGFELEADLGKRGDLDSEFKLADMRRSDKRIEGIANGGGPKLDVETYRGHIELRSSRR